MNNQYTVVNQETFSSDIIDPPQQKSFRVYKRRWIILLIYVCYAILNSFQIYEYSIIAHLVTKYYGISNAQVDWTSVIFMALYVPLVIPACYVIERKGLRFAALLGAIGTAVGTTVKVFSMSRDSFWLVYCGQFILASMVVFIQPLPTKLASVWFAQDQVSSACGLGIFGTYLGQTSGLFLAPLIIRNHDNIEDIGREIGYLSYTLATLSVIVAIVVVFYFPNEPPTPPSINEAILRQDHKKKHLRDFWGCLKHLFMDYAFVLHIIAYGGVVGTSSAFLTLFNQMVTTSMPESENEIGTIMMCVCIVGCISLFIFGYALDKTHKYNDTAVTVTFIMALFFLVHIYGMESKTISVIYVMFTVNGFMLSGYMVAGYELAVELTYPEAESTSTGILISTSQVSGTLIVVILEYLLQANFFYGLFFFPATCLVCAIVTACLPTRLRRQHYVGVNC